MTLITCEQPFIAARLVQYLSRNTRKAYNPNTLLSCYVRELSVRICDAT